MSKKIAICIDAFAFQNNRIFDRQWAEQFPGAVSTSILAEMLQVAGYTVVTGDVALSHVRSGYWNAEDITLVQDMDCSDGLELIAHGANPKILSAFESPVFASSFYDQLPKLAPQFEHRILFGGAFDSFTASNGYNHIAHFPTFYKGRIPPPLPWNERKFMVIVAGNKHCKRPRRFPLSLNPGRYIKWMRKQLAQKSSSSLQSAIKNELQTQRLEAIEYFGNLGKVKLYGVGWNRLSKLPNNWEKRLKGIFSDIAPQPCKDKIKTISKYKFAICFENISYPGYVTEKIIDCFVAGVIPIYLGAPDICDFVQEKTFIDMRQFNSWHELDKYLEGFEEEQAIQIIKDGQDFLRSPQGQKHSFEFFAQYLFDLILQ